MLCLVSQEAGLWVCIGFWPMARQLLRNDRSVGEGRLCFIVLARSSKYSTWTNTAEATISKTTSLPDRCFRPCHYPWESVAISLHVRCLVHYGNCKSSNFWRRANTRDWNRRDGCEFGCSFFSWLAYNCTFILYCGTAHCQLIVRRAVNQIFNV